MYNGIKDVIYRNLQLNQSKLIVFFIFNSNDSNWRFQTVPKLISVGFVALLFSYDFLYG